MTDLQTLTEQLKEIQKTSQKAFGQIKQPEMLAEMTEEQKKLISRAENAFNLDGLEPSEKLEELQKILKDVANFNK